MQQTRKAGDICVSSVKKYLRLKNWEEVVIPNCSKMNVWRYQREKVSYHIMIPPESCPDYQTRIMDALHTLQKIENREAFKIFDDIVSFP